MNSFVSIIYLQITNMYSSQKMFSVLGPKYIYPIFHTTIIAHEFLWKQLKNTSQLSLYAQNEYGNCHIFKYNANYIIHPQKTPAYFRSIVFGLNWKEFSNTLFGLYWHDLNQSYLIWFQNVSAFRHLIIKYGW